MRGQTSEPHRWACPWGGHGSLSLPLEASACLSCRGGRGGPRMRKASPTNPDPWFPYRRDPSHSCLGPSWWSPSSREEAAHRGRQTQLPQNASSLDLHVLSLSCPFPEGSLGSPALHYSSLPALHLTRLPVPTCPSLGLSPFPCLLPGCQTPHVHHHCWRGPGRVRW